VLKSHPGFEASSEIVTVGRNNGTNFMPLSKNVVERIREDMTSLASITGVGTFTLELEPGGEQAPIEYLEKSFFQTMRPHLQLGRGFDESDHEEDAAPVTIISHAFWLDHFGGRSDAIGRTIRITGTPQLFRFVEGEPVEPEEQSLEYRIVGVMAESYESTFGGETSIWLPFEQAAPIFLGDSATVAEVTLLYAFVRLDEARRTGPIVTELNDRYGGLVEEFNLPPGTRLDAMPGIVRSVIVQRDAERQVRMLLVGGILLALAAAANVSLFLLSRAPGRRRELGIRMSVGAPLKRLARQLATEAGLLVLVAALLGLLIGVWLNVLLQDLSFLRDAQWRDVSIDWRVLLMVFALTLVLTALVSLGPVLGLRRLSLAASSRSVGARPGLTQHLAGNLQIAAACILAAVAGAFGWYLGVLMFGDNGFETEDLHVVTLDREPFRFINFDEIDYDALLAERDRKRQAVLALPGIEAVAFGTSVPGRVGFVLNARFEKEDGSNEFISFRLVSADPAYTELLGMRLVDGRRLTDADRTGMLVNEAFALDMWGRTDVAGEVFPGGFTDSEQTEIVGVLEDVSFDHPSDEVGPLAFVYMTPFSNQEALLIRSPLSPGELRTVLQGAIDEGALELALADVERLSDIAFELIAADRARSLIAVATALLVVVLAAFGFYGTQRFLVAAGRREFAIRAALGAGPRAIGRLVLARALLLGAPGLAFGSVLAFIAVTWMREDFVPESVSPIAVTLAVLVTVAALLLASTLAPARSARNTEAGPLLKQE
jgi:putative ABC transport system permease protein